MQHFERFAYGSVKGSIQDFLHVKDLFEKRIPFIPSILTTSMKNESDYIIKSNLLTSELSTCDNTITEELIGS